MRDPLETERYVTKFAWFPIEPAWGKTAWLRTVTIRQVFMRFHDRYVWVDMEFVDPGAEARMRELKKKVLPSTLTPDEVDEILARLATGEETR